MLRTTQPGVGSNHLFPRLLRVNIREREGEHLPVTCTFSERPKSLETVSNKTTSPGKREVLAKTLGLKPCSDSRCSLLERVFPLLNIFTKTF